MKCISYSLFGYNKARNENCFDFNSYLRSLMLCVRMNRLIFPDWTMVVHMDKSTHEGFKPLFDSLIGERFEVVLCEDAPLTLAMLWRMKPIFECLPGSEKKYSHVICRDLDSLATYREAQAVKYWVDKDKAAHAITDSVSHNLPMLGGMIGFVPKHFTMKTNFVDWKDLVRQGDYEWSIKGSDQSFLNDKVYPVFARQGVDSITQHYFNGMPNTFLSDFHTCNCPPVVGHADNCANNYPVDLPEDYKESNGICGHVGASGFYEPATFRFLRKHKEKFTDLIELEKQYPDVFYWTKDKTFE